MQAPPGAPGTARQGNTRIIMLVNDSGIATQPKAPGHDRPLAAPPAARHDRPVAIPRAPGADVPSAPTAGAPGQHRPRAAKKAPGHDRPHAALPAARHGRPVAIPRAPGADVPPASPAGAPGQHRPRAAKKAPGHDRPHAALPAAWHGRPVAIPKAPGRDVPSASPAGAPGPHRLRAVANATAPSPAGQHRPRQEGLPHTPANPRTLIYLHTHQDTAHTRTTDLNDFNRRSHASMSRTPIRGGNPSCSSFHPENPDADNPLHPLSNIWRGGRGVRPTTPTTNQAHPASQDPPHPRSCSTADTGFLLNHPARAPPPPASSLRRRPQSSPRSPYPARVSTHPSPNVGEVTGQRRTTPGTIRAALAGQGAGG